MFKENRRSTEDYIVFSYDISISISQRKNCPNATKKEEEKKQSDNHCILC